MFLFKKNCFPYPWQSCTEFLLIEGRYTHRGSWSKIRDYNTQWLMYIWNEIIIMPFCILSDLCDLILYRKGKIMARFGGFHSFFFT